MKNEEFSTAQSSPHIGGVRGGLSYWEALAERYFLAETTEEEEAQLRRFLCSSQAQDSRFDEIRATMSLLYVSRPKHRLYVKHPYRAIAVAACLCVAMFLGWRQYQQHNISSVRIAGEDVEVDASQLMQQQMAEVLEGIRD